VLCLASGLALAARPVGSRRDIARSDTQIGAAKIIGMRVNDLYTNTEYYRTMTEPFDEVCRRYNWTPPWSLQNGGKQPASSLDQGSVDSSTPPPSS
jgi:hypothetical protein